MCVLSASKIRQQAVLTHEPGHCKTTPSFGSHHSPSYGSHKVITFLDNPVIMLIPVTYKAYPGSRWFAQRECHTNKYLKGAFLAGSQAGSHFRNWLLSENNCAGRADVCMLHLALHDQSRWFQETFLCRTIRPFNQASQWSASLLCHSSFILPGTAVGSENSFAKFAVHAVINTYDMRQRQAIDMCWQRQHASPSPACIREYSSHSHICVDSINFQL